MIKTPEATIINTKKVNTRRWKEPFLITTQDRLIKLVLTLQNCPKLLLSRNNTAFRQWHRKTANKTCKSETSRHYKAQQHCNALQVHSNYRIDQTEKILDQLFPRKQVLSINKILLTSTLKLATKTTIKSSKPNTTASFRVSAIYSRHKAKQRSTRCFKK